jgi:hypothetical protein
MGNFDLFFPWDKGFGAPASSANWRKMAQLWSLDGVLINYNQMLAATLAGSQVTINPGAVFVHGYYAEVVSAQTINVGVNGTVVAKADLVNENCLIYYKDQAIDYSGYEQDASAWEIPLWLVSGSTLIDLRTWIGCGAGAGWAGSSPGLSTVPSAQTVQLNLLTPRVAYVGAAQLAGSMMVIFSDASQAQSAICQLTYQFGASDQAVTPVITPQIPGGGAAGSPVYHAVSVTGQITVGQGKKSVGWRVTAGTGPQIQVSQMTVSMNLVDAAPAQ